jgi:beta-lactamase class A
VGALSVLLLVLAACVAATPVLTGGSQSVAPALAADAPVEPGDTVQPARDTVSMPPAGLPGDPDLEDALRDAIGPGAGHVSVVVRRLADARGAAIEPGRVFYAASLFKLALLYEAARRIGEGTLGRGDRLYVDPGDAAQDLGTLADLPLAADGSLSVAEALEAMVVMSDNATAVAFMRLLGNAEVDATLAWLGLTQTSVNTEELPTTAADMALLMEALATGRGLTPEAAAEARSLLLQQKTRTGIPAGLPAGAPAGNKTGTWPGSTHDVAFVDAPRGLYVIAVLTDGDWDWEPIARVSAAAWGVLAGTRE